MTYVVVFLISSFAAGRVQHARQRYRRVFWALVCVLLPAIFLGGLRSATLGTDNYKYYRTMFARYHASTSLFHPPSTSTVTQTYYEPLFSALMFFVSRFTSDYHWFCFVTVLIQMSLVLAGFMYFKKQVSVGFTMLAYYLMFFCIFVHLVRQSLAVAVCIFAFRYVAERKPIKFLICVAIAACFHITAVVFLLAYIVALYRASKKQNRWVIIISLAVLALYFLSPQILRFLLQTGLLRSHYAMYFSSTVQFKFSQFLYRIPLLVFTGLFLKRLAKKDSVWYSMFLFLVFDIVISQLAANESHAVRLAYYFGVFAVPCYSGISRTFDNPKDRLVPYGIALGYLAWYWIYWIALNHISYSMPVFPYVSDVIPWLF